MIIKILLLLNFIFIPSFLFANAGTPLVYAHLLYLFPMNLIIAFIELSYMNKKYNVLEPGQLKANSFFLIISDGKPLLPIILIIVANYLSAVVGFIVHYFILKYSSLKWDPLGYAGTDENIIKIVFLSGSFILSVLIEYPFIYKIVRKKVSKVDCFKLDLKVHLLSYSILGLQYFILCNPNIFN